MPTYEYICRNCTHEFEAFQRMSDEPLAVCPQCDQSALKRKIGTGAGIIFKGGGFYETDFKEKKGSRESQSGVAGASGPDKEQKKSDASTSVNGSGASATPPKAATPAAES